MTMDTKSNTEEALARLLLREEVEQFLYLEASYLDERKFNDWIELIADDIHYFMPIRRNVKFGEQERENTDFRTEISWFDEGKRTLTGVHWAEEPFSRIRHLVTNVRVIGVDGDEIRVDSNFFVWQNRLHDEVNLFAGKREDILRRDPDTEFKIAKRTIILDQNVLLAKVITTFF